MRVINKSVTRVHAGLVAKPGKSCPSYLASKSRPEPTAPAVRLGLESYSTGPVDQVLDMVEIDGRTVARAHQDYRASERGGRCHPGLLRWTEHAVRVYLQTAEVLAKVDGCPLRPRAREWAVQHPLRPTSQDSVREIRAFGRRYESEDGRIREIRLLRGHSVDERRRTVPPPLPAELATTAFVLADGRTVIGKWLIPYTVSPSRSTAQRVRIVEVGLADGSHAVVFDETADTARELYRATAREALAKSIDGDGHRPGYDCVRCPLRADCPALVRLPGLLGVDDRSKPTRTFSITTGRRFRTCPTQAHLRELRLPYPADREYGIEARRGKAVHEWIEHQHTRAPGWPCSAGDVPLGPSWWSAWALHGDDALLGEQMISDHAEVCPHRTMSVGDTISPEHPLVVFDPLADVVVHAKVDTWYTENGTTVLREMKTTTYPIEGDLLHFYPQIALALVLAADGVLGDRCRVELEHLTPAGPIVTRFDPADRWVVGRAREVVHALARPWHADLEMRPEPGRACESCEVSLWCPAFPESEK